MRTRRARHRMREKLRRKTGNTQTTRRSAPGEWNSPRNPLCDGFSRKYFRHPDGTGFGRLLPGRRQDQRLNAGIAVVRGTHHQPGALFKQGPLINRRDNRPPFLKWFYHHFLKIFLCVFASLR